MNLSSVYGAEGVESECIRMEKRTHNFLKSKFRFIGLPFFNGIILGRWEGLSEQEAHKVFMTDVIVTYEWWKAFQETREITDGEEKMKWPNTHGRRVVNNYTLFRSNICYNHPEGKYVVQYVISSDGETRSRITLDDVLCNPRFFIRFEQGLMGTYLIAQYWIGKNDAPDRSGFNWLARSIDYDKNATLGDSLNYIDRVCLRDTCQPGFPYAYTHEAAIFSDKSDEFDWLDKTFSMSSYEYIEKLYKTKTNDLSIRAFYDACQENAADHILDKGVHQNQFIMIMDKLMVRHMAGNTPDYLRKQYYTRQHRKKKDRRDNRRFKKLIRG